MSLAGHPQNTCEECSGFAGFEKSPEGQVCDICDRWLCDDCINWSIDIRHDKRFSHCEYVCLTCSTG